MADNSSVPVASGNETFANDDVGGVKYPRHKIAWGPDGTANDADTASGKPLPTQLRTALGAEIELPALIDSKTPVTNLPVASGGYSVNRNFDVDETEDNISTSPCQLYILHLVNNAATIMYVKLYDEVAANVTVGTTTPKLTIPLPPRSASGNPCIWPVAFPHGVPFATALCIAATTARADNDTGAPATNDVEAYSYYK